MKILNNKNQSLFIKTKDFDTCEELKKLGYELIDSTDNTWTFINDLNRPLTFDNKKVAYSDVLCF